MATKTVPQMFLFCVSGGLRRNNAQTRLMFFVNHDASVASQGSFSSLTLRFFRKEHQQGGAGKSLQRVPGQLSGTSPALRKPIAILLCNHGLSI